MKKIEEEIVQLQENEAKANHKVEFVADQVRLALTKVRTCNFLLNFVKYIGSQFLLFV